jgi:hypothetical protein
VNLDNLKSFLDNGAAPWLIAGGASGLLLALWGNLRGWATRLLMYTVVPVKLDADLAAEFMARLARGNAPKALGGKSYMVLSRYVRSERKQRWVLARWVAKKDVSIYWRKGKFFSWPIVVDRGPDGDIMTFRYFRGTLDMEKELAEIVGTVNTRTGSRYQVHQVGGEEKGGNNENRRSGSEENAFTQCIPTATYLDVDFEDVGAAIHQGRVEDLWWCKDGKELLDDAVTWFANRQWYVDRRLPWRRGYLVHGVPGTGKTASARALALKFDFPVWSFDLGSMDNADLRSAFKQVRSTTPCMVLIEDIDTVYRGREAANPNEHRGTPPSFDALLNMLDGAEALDGVMVVITTNVVENVDTALGGLMAPDGTVLPAEGAKTRPGRIDRVVRLPPVLEPEGRRWLAQRSLDNGKLEELINIGVDDTPAQFAERVVRAGLMSKA